MKLPKLGKIHIRNRFLQKNLISLIVIAVLAIGTGTAYGTLSSRDADRGEDPVYGIDQERYQVLISGEGYKLSKDQEKNYKLQKKQNKINAANAAQNPNTFRSSTGPRTFRSGSSYRYRYHGHTYKISKTPRVTTNIFEQKSMKTNWKAGDTFEFRVSAYAYPYGLKNRIPAKDIKVSVKGGKAAKLYKSENGYHYYSVVLGKGTNKITISATDKKTKKTAKSGPYIITATKKSSSGGKQDKPEEPTQPEKTKVTVDYGLGTFTSNDVTIEDSTTAYDILSKTPGVTVGGGEIKYIEFDEESFDIDAFREQFEGELELAYQAYVEACDEDEDVLDIDTWFSENVDQKIRVNGKIRLGAGYPFDSTSWQATPESGKALKNGITLSLILYQEGEE